jgi:ribosome-associated translation inhibitor RaiA
VPIAEHEAIVNREL